MPDWILQNRLVAGCLIALASALLSVAVATFVLVRLPSDHFTRDQPPHFPSLPQPLRGLAVVAKNLLGLAIVVLGVALSLPGVPGQGVLTTLLGLMLLDFPGRRALERRLVAFASVRRGIDRLRARFHRPPMQRPASTRGGTHTRAQPSNTTHVH